MTGTMSARWKLVMQEAARAAGAIAIALAVAFVIVFLTANNPAKAFTTLLTAPLSSLRTFGLWVDDTVKLTLSGLAFALVFQARQFSLGVQGQVFVGGLAASFIALSPLGTTWMAIPLGMLGACAAGGIYGFIPGFAKTRFGANEIVSSLMLNYIAVLGVNYAVRTYLAPAGTGQLMSEKFPASAIYPAFVTNTRIDLGLVIAAVLVFVVWFALYRTRWGLKLRLVGLNPQFAEYGGIRSDAILVGAMAAAGAIGGLLGAVFVQGRSFGQIVVDFDGGLSFEGILVAIVARNRPLAVPVVALFYGYLRQGAQLMSIRTGVPSEVIQIVQAIILILVTSSFSVPWRRWLDRLFARRRPREERTVSI